jgi:hypothetical protein
MKGEGGNDIRRFGAMVMVLRCTHTWMNGERHGVISEPRDRSERHIMIARIKSAIRPKTSVLTSLAQYI